MTRSVREPRPRPRPRRPRVVTLPQLLARAVEATPSGVAVLGVAADGVPAEATYREMDERSTRLARVLIARGIGPENLVALGIPRSIESVTACWAVARTGAGFVPVDPNYPRDRVAHMLSDSGAAVGITVADVRADLPDDIEWLVLDDPATSALLAAQSAEPIIDADRVRRLRAEHPAYVIYTSGSTGMPKGVVVTQAGLASFCEEQRTRYRVTESSRTLHFASPSFDASVLELLLAIGGAATMVVAAPTVYGGAELAALLRRNAVTHAFITPAALASIDPEGLDALRVVVVGGEACPPELVRRWAIPLADGSTREFYNGYGPTETTIMTNISDPLVPGELVTIGAPIRDMAAYVLDSRLHRVPTGVTGELYLAGAQLARGYGNRPGLSAQRFVADPFAADGARMYRTGDLVRRTSAGDLEYLGRNDFQVKIRGFRIELGEIDAVLAGHEKVDFAVTVGHALDNGSTILAAYVHAAAGVAVDAAELTTELVALAERHLPAHMVPTSITVLDEIPLTPVGKLDRRALPAPVLRTTVFRAPSGRYEEMVARVFGELVGDGSPVGAADDFFELGGNSLIATQAAARLGAALETKVPARSIFENSSVAKLAERLAELSGGNTGGGLEELRAVPRPERIPLSPAQQRMWFLNRFDPGSSAYSIPIAIRLTGALDVAALTAAFDDLIARHEVLRTVYPETTDGPVQVILPPGESVPRLAVREIAPEHVRSAIGEHLTGGFDVTAEVPLRAVLFRVGATQAGADIEHVLAIAVHHIAGDGSSGVPLTRDLMTAYVARVAGHAPMWAPLPVQYADYSIWQRRVLGSEDDPASVAAGQLAYWRTALADLPEQLDLPADRPRPTTQSFAGDVVDLRIDAATHRALTDLGRGRGATLFMVVHTAFAVLLSRLSGAQDLAIGTPIAGRGEAALEDLIGMFVNTLVFRSRIDASESFESLLARQREVDIQAFAHADVPFERLVEVLNPARSQARHPLFQVGLSFQNQAKASLELPGLTVSGVDFDTQVSQFDLHLILTDTYDEHGVPTGVAGVFTYASDLFERPTVEVFARRFVRLLDAVVAAPGTAVGDLALLDRDERRELVSGRNDTAHPLEPALLLDGYRRAVVEHADAVAVVYEGAELTYRELDERVNRLARLLIARGVGPESLVGLAVRRSLDLVVGMYAIVTAGGAYVPLDPDHPAERIAHVLDTARPACVLSTTADAVPVPAGTDVVLLDAVDLSGYSTAPVQAGELRRPVRRDNPAYVIFTSGSTGRPKGVTVSHGAIDNQIAWMLSEYPMGPGDGYLHKTATTFDLSLWGYFMPLRTGAKLVVATHDGLRDPAYLAETVAAQQVTVTDFVPSMLTVFAAHTAPGSVPTLREVFVIGEALPPETVTAWYRVSDARLHNLYGPTETAVSVTYWPARGDDERTVPIGLPQWNVAVYVLDSRLRPVPDGVAGELYLGGEQLARGYVARADLSADRFVANPFVPGARMYRTGDLVRWRSGVAGQPRLEYIGRTDFQVKFRGFRIELGEIDTALLAQPEINQAVTLVVSSVLGDQLVAYVVPRPGQVADQSALRAAISESLPPYMVPAAIVVLDAFPLNASGKLDRKALPEPVFASREFRPPSTPIEEIVAGVFADVLGVTRVGVDDDFFALGGNSLIATQVVARLGAALDAVVPVRLLFEAPTVAALAVAVEALSGTGRRPRLVARSRPERIPLSPAQQRMWLLHSIDGGSAVYNIPAAVRLSGELSVSALREAFGDVLARHEVLRTVYPAHDGVAYQVVLPVDRVRPELPARVVPASEVPERIVRVVTTGFDVTAEVPVRVELLRVAEEPSEYVLVLVVHHISADGWSMAPFTRDLMIAYAARVAGSPPGWQPLPVQYADYSLWQRELLGEESDPQSVAARQLGYWRTALAGLPDALDLPFDRPRPALQDTVARSVVLNIDAATHRALLAVAREHNATLFMAVHTALAVLLARWSRSDDIAIGSPIAGRGEAALDDLIGMFVNTLVLRTRVDPAQSFGELLGRQREIDLAAFAHADVPFEHLVEVLDPVRSTARHPVFQIMLAFQNQARAGLELPGLSVSAMEFDAEQTEYDLQLMLGDGYDEHGEPIGIGGRILFPVSLFDESTIQTLARRFERLLAALAVEPAVAVGDVEWLTEAERAEVLAARNVTDHPIAVRNTADYPLTVRNTADYPLDAAATLVSLSAFGSRVDPRAVAIVDGALTDERTEISYAEWDARVHRLARYLIERGVGPESRVVVALHRSVDLLVAVHAVLRAGGAYVPVDPDHPEDRTAYVLELSEPACVLTHAAADFRADRVPVIRIDELDLSGYRDEPVTDAERIAPLRPANTAYILFTSGSTGRPKGVAVPHRAVANHVRWFIADYSIGAADISLFKTTITFDMSVWDVFVPFIVGGRLVVAGRDGHRDPRYLAEVIAAERVTVIPFVPSMLRAILDTDTGTSLEGGALASLRVIWLGGEALSADTAVAARRVSRARLDNLYGPTEAAVATMTARVPEDATGIVPIGMPTSNVGAYVLDDRLHPVPVGVAGELYHGGIQLSRGYFGRPDLTAARYVASPFVPGERLYRTGDLVRWNADGHMEYLGRTDFQVKLRGLRIELGEIEAALLTHDAVRQAVATVHTDDQIGDQLVGYVVPEPAVGEVEIESVKAHLAERVPSYMVPSVFVVLDALPLNANGKLDRKALPAPVFQAREFRAPSTPMEEIVAGVFAAVLGVERVGADDDFFALGGNSLIAAQVAARLSAATGTEVPVRWLFETGTVAALAARVESEAKGAGGRRRPPLVAGPRPDHIPLSLAQQRMWLASRIDTGVAVYTIPAAIALSGELSVPALREAMTDVVTRHEALRTYYPARDGIAHQVIVTADRVVPDLAAEPVPSAELRPRIAREMATPFDLTSEVPLRITLLRVDGDPSQHVLVLVVHHISADGWSMAPVTRDLVVAYAARVAGAVPGWTPLPVQYADFSLWQHRVLGDEADPDSEAARQLDYWRTELAGLPDALPLPFDRPRPAARDTRARRVTAHLDADLHRDLTEFARAERTTLFMVLHGALAVLLSKLSGTDDLTVGTPVAGRGEEALDDVVGMFVNTLVLRSRVDPARSFTEFLSAQQESDLAAFANTDIPFERVVEAVNPARSQSRHPLFQVMFALQNLAKPRLELPGLSVSGIEFDSESIEYDLQVTLADGYDSAGTPEGIACTVAYRTSLFDHATIESLVRRFEQVLRVLVTEPGTAVRDIEILDPAEREVVLCGWNRTTHEIPWVGLVPDLFAESVRRYADRTAVVADQGESGTGQFAELTYAQFSARVNRLARRLIELGVGPDVRVAVGMRRSVDMLVAVYAALAAGGAYVPVDPDHPAERTEYVLDNAAPAVLLTTTRDDIGTSLCPVVQVDTADLGAYDDSPIQPAERRGPLRPEHIAYVLYTSGSTGRPKGVAIAHASMVNQLAWRIDAVGMNETDVVMHKTPFTFDASLWELFAPLIMGARMILTEPQAHRDARYLAETIHRHRVTLTSFVPTLLAVFATTASEAECASLRSIFSGGEALTPHVVGLLRSVTSAALVNVYGPTEVTVNATGWPVADDEISVPIGRPVWNSRVHVLDESLHPVAPGVAGELYLGGVQIARGYHARPDLTAQRFVADPFGEPGERLYRTGDLARWKGNADSGAGPLEDGVLEFLGRTDFQVKFHGQRIELEEIEAALLEHRDIEQAAVQVISTSTGEHLVAYVVAGAGAGAAGLDVEDVKNALRRRLPAYMVPSTVVTLDEFPLNTSGKLDRKALPVPEFRAREYRAPAGPIEEAVAEVFAEALDLPRVGADDDFFELGGNSLIAIRVAARLGTALDTGMPVRLLFEASTVAALAARLAEPDAADSTESAYDVLLPLRAGTGAPLFCIHPFGGIAWSFAGLSAHVDRDRPIYGLQSPALGSDETLPETAEKWAVRYLEEIRAVQPEGPYHLLGWSLGGVLAHAIAVQLQTEGERVELLAMMDSYLRVEIEEPAIESGPAPVAELLGGLLGDAAQLALGDIEAAAEVGPAEIAERLARLPEPFASFGAQRIGRVLEGAVHSAAVTARYRPLPFVGDLVYFAAAEDDPAGRTGADTWRGAIEGTIRVHPVPTSHWRMTTETGLGEIGRVLDEVHRARQAGSLRS